MPLFCNDFLSEWEAGHGGGNIQYFPPHRWDFVGTGQGSIDICVSYNKARLNSLDIHSKYLVDNEKEL